MTLDVKIHPLKHCLKEHKIALAFIIEEVILTSMQGLHSFGLKAEAQAFETISTFDELDVVKSCQGSYLILGEGTNTVFIENYMGSVFKVALKGIEINKGASSYRIKVGAGENWHHLVKQLLEVNIFGLENLAYIPGTVGAAPVQNIGAYGAEFSHFCHSVSCYDLTQNKPVTLSQKDCQFGYRDSVFKSHFPSRYIILSVELELPIQWKPNLNYKGLDHLGAKCTAKEVFNAVIAIRKSKLPDPEKIGNAGSFFKNPVITQTHYAMLKAAWPAIPSYSVNDQLQKVPAAWLIEQCGFKGKAWGDIVCHPKQPLVLANQGNASGSELLEAARNIKSDVFERFQIHLENEVRLIGATGEVAL